MPEYNNFNTESVMQLPEEYREMALMYAAHVAWKAYKLLTNDHHCKTYDPLHVEGGRWHSYVFGAGGRHGNYESLEDVEKMLVESIAEEMRMCPRRKGVSDA